MAEKKPKKTAPKKTAKPTAKTKPRTKPKGKLVMKTKTVRTAKKPVATAKKKAAPVQPKTPPPTGSNVIWKLLEARKAQRTERAQANPNPNTKGDVIRLHDQHGKFGRFAGPRRRAV